MCNGNIRIKGALGTMSDFSVPGVVLSPEWGLANIHLKFEKSVFTPYLFGSNRGIR